MTLDPDPTAPPDPVRPARTPKTRTRQPAGPLGGGVQRGLAGPVRHAGHRGLLGGALVVDRRSPRVGDPGGVHERPRGSHPAPGRRHQPRERAGRTATRHLRRRVPAARRSVVRQLAHRRPGDDPREPPTRVSRKARPGTRSSPRPTARCWRSACRSPRPSATYFQFSSVDDLDVTLGVLGSALAIGAVGAAIVGALTGAVISGRVMRPLRDISDVAHDVASGRSDARLDVHGDPDLTTLAASFNGMVDELQERVHREKRASPRTSATTCAVPSPRSRRR